MTTLMEQLDEYIQEVGEVWGLTNEMRKIINIMIMEFPKKWSCCYECSSEYDTDEIDDWCKRWLGLVQELPKDYQNSDF